MNWKLVIVILIALLLTCVVPADTTKADPGWNWYKDVAFAASDVTGIKGTHSNFPVLISTTDADLKHTGSGGGMGKTDATDLRFTDTGNNTLYDYEIEKYVSGTGELVVWVRVPTLADAGTTIRMWYGNAAAADGQNVTGVWDSNYKMVHHLQETGANPQVFDSTSNDNDSTSNSADPTTSGQINGAHQFTSANSDYVDMGNSSSLLMGSGDFTVAGWVKTGSSPGSIVGKGSDDSGGKRYKILISTGGVASVEIDDDGAGNKRVVLSGSSHDDNNWHHIVGVRDGNNLRLYVDGSEDPNSPTDITGYGSVDNARSAAIGGIYSESSGWQQFSNGLIDETRISATVRSADWIKTSFNNQNAPGTFHSIDASPTDVSEGADPVPELPTIILMSMGLVGLGIWLWLRTRRLVYAR